MRAIDIHTIIDYLYGDINIEQEESLEDLFDKNQDLMIFMDKVFNYCIQNHISKSLFTMQLSQNSILSLADLWNQWDKIQNTPKETAQADFTNKNNSHPRYGTIIMGSIIVLLILTGIIFSFLKSGTTAKQGIIITNLPEDKLSNINDISTENVELGHVTSDNQMIVTKLDSGISKLDDLRSTVYGNNTGNNEKKVEYPKPADEDEDDNSEVKLPTKICQIDTTRINLKTANKEEAGSFKMLLTNKNGCDSLVITSITYEPYISQKVHLRSFGIFKQTHASLSIEQTSRTTYTIVLNASALPDNSRYGEVYQVWGLQKKNKKPIPKWHELNKEYTYTERIQFFEDNFEATRIGTYDKSKEVNSKTFAFYQSEIPDFFIITTERLGRSDTVDFNKIIVYGSAIKSSAKKKDKSKKWWQLKLPKFNFRKDNKEHKTKRNKSRRIFKGRNCMGDC